MRSPDVFLLFCFRRRKTQKAPLKNAERLETVSRLGGAFFSNINSSNLMAEFNQKTSQIVLENLPPESVRQAVARVVEIGRQGAEIARSFEQDLINLGELGALTFPHNQNEA
jgi:hypothetical protein